MLNIALGIQINGIGPLVLMELTTGKDRSCKYSMTSSTSSSTTSPFTKHLACTKRMSDTFMLILFHPALKRILYGSYHYFSHFTHKENEAQKGQVTS